MILKKQKHPDDIRIDHRRWIALQSPRVRPEAAVQIDEFVSRIPKFWDELETRCVAGCCGIAAFGFWEQDLCRAFEKCGIGVRETIDGLRSFVAGHEAEWFVSGRLNQFFPRESLLELLNPIGSFPPSGRT